MTTGAPAKAMTELAEEIRRLEEQVAKERLGTCVYAVGGDATSAQMTEISCALLNGTWIDGAIGSVDEAKSSAETLKAALQRKLDSNEPAPEETGVCVFAAGGKVCQAETTAGQCDLIAGQWFPVSIDECNSKEV